MRELLFEQELTAEQADELKRKRLERFGPVEPAETTQNTQAISDKRENKKPSTEKI